MINHLSMGHLFVHCLQFLIRDRRPLPTQHRSQIPKLHGALPTRCYGRGGVNGTRAVEEKDWTRRGNSGFCIWYLDKYMYLYVVLLWSILYTYIYVCFLYAFVHICTHTNTLVCRHTICWIKDALPETSKPGTWSSRFIRWCHPMMCVCVLFCPIFLHGDTSLSLEATASFEIHVFLWADAAGGRLNWLPWAYFFSAETRVLLVFCLTNSWKNRSVWRVPKIDTPKSSILGKCHCQYV